MSIKPFVCIKKKKYQNLWGEPGPPAAPTPSPGCYGTDTILEEEILIGVNADIGKSKREK